MQSNSISSLIILSCSLLLLMVNKNSPESIELQQIIDDLTTLQTSNDIPIDILLESSKKAISQQVALLSRVSVKMMNTYDWDAVYAMRDNILWNFIELQEMLMEEKQNCFQITTKSGLKSSDAIYNSSTDQ